MRIRIGSSLLLAVLVLISTSWIGCDSSVADDPPADDLPVTLSGVVRDQDTNSPLSDITVELNSAQTKTTDQAGRFEFRDVPLGANALRVSETGFDDYTRQINVSAGDNSHDVSLLRITLYEFDEAGDFYELYLPAGGSTYRGVIFLGEPSTQDTRGFASGIPRTNAAPGLNEFVAAERQRSLQLAETYGLALMGAEVTRSTVFLVRALEHFAEESGHPELAKAPVLAMGFSFGGCLAYEFTLDHPDRVIGFMTAKGSCHDLGDAGLARRVPGYLFIGGEDAPNRALNITDVFEENRPQGALWSLVIEQGTGHIPVDDQTLLFNWMDAVLEARLPETPPPGEPVVLRAIDEATGWLGNRSSFEIADYAGYDADRLQASWLPSMQTAQDWQAFASSVAGD
ncbi:MAG: hypothetical protein HKN37_08985 [Rhodothermales bacterium]|nr:hypothetical protein [Rhodothermales bacterium]